jgi:CBS domain-containing protein
MDLLSVAAAARPYQVRRLVFAQIGRPVLKAVDRGEKPPFGEVARDGQVFRISVLEIGMSASAKRFFKEKPFKGGSVMAGMVQAVSQVMTENPVILQANDTLVEAARKMRAEDIGDVLVMREGALCGIVTDRDITVRATADGKDPNQVKLGDICSQQMVTITAESPVSEAVSLMRSKALRRLPVVQGDKPVGIVSIGDLAVELDQKSVLASISAAEPND